MINSGQQGCPIAVLLVNENETSCKSNVQLFCYAKFEYVTTRRGQCVCVLPQGTQYDSLSVIWRSLLLIHWEHTVSLTKQHTLSTAFEVPEWKEMAFTLQKHSDSPHFVLSPWFADCVNLWQYEDNFNWKMGLSNMTLIVVRTNELK